MLKDFDTELLYVLYYLLEIFEYLINRKINKDIIKEIDTSVSVL